MPTGPKKSGKRRGSPQRSSQPAANKARIWGVIAALDAARKQTQKTDVFLEVAGISEAEAKLLTPEQREARLFTGFSRLPTAEQKRMLAKLNALLTPEQRRRIKDDRTWDDFFDHFDPALFAEIYDQKTKPALIPAAEPPSIVPENHVERQMREQAKKSFVQNGVRYWPLSFAAPLAQAHRTTILHWVKNKTEVAGKPIQSYYFAPSDQYFISDESIKRAAARFIKWPSQEPAGPVTLGETTDRSGYIGLPEARGILGISNRTMYLWATQGKAPTDRPLDIIKDPISDHLYIREKDVYDLKKRIPRSGLQRGRRPTLQP
jgi:hypothetical protein